MCLEVKENAKVKLARKDIVCYKSVERQDRLKPGCYTHGECFKGNIRDIDCEGHISIDKQGRIFFCTDIADLDGCDAFDKMGHKYSWIFDEEVKNINGELHLIGGFKTPYQNFPVQIGETYNTEIRRYMNEIDEGFHSYKTLEDAQKENDGSITCKCIIPANSKYYEGTFGGSIAYASNAIKYVEVIE